MSSDTEEKFDRKKVQMLNLCSENTDQPDQHLCFWICKKRYPLNYGSYEVL